MKRLLVDVEDHNADEVLRLATRAWVLDPGGPGKLPSATPQKPTPVKWPAGDPPTGGDDGAPGK